MKTLAWMVLTPEVRQAQVNERVQRLLFELDCNSNSWGLLSDEWHRTYRDRCLASLRRINPMIANDAAKAY